MNALVLVLLIAAALLALGAAANVASARFNLLAAAFLCFVLAELIPALAAL